MLFQSRMPVFFLFLALPGLALAKKVKTYEQDGVTVSIEPVKSTLKGWKAFSIKAANETLGFRSLNARIYLNNRNRKEPRGKSGTCTVFIELGPKEQKQETKQCKEVASSNSYSFEIIKVYQFALNKKNASDTVVTTEFTGEGERFEQDGVIVFVKKEADSIKNYKSFTIKAKNTNRSNKTLNGRIYLANSTQKQPKGGSGKCTVYIELQPLEEKTESKQCKERSPSDSYSFEIKKVYNF